MRSAAALVLSLGLLPVPAAAASYAALQRSTELQYWDASRAQSGYTFFGVGGTTYLLDMEGRVVHTWPIGTNPHLLSDGSVLDASTDDPSGFGSFKQVAWDGTTLWTYKETRSTYHPHHDFTRIWNPKLKAYTTLFIANKDLTYAQLVAAGADPSRTPSTGGQMDAIVEVDATGTVVWEWCFFDHVVQDFDATKPNYVGSGKTIASYPNRLNINLTGHNLKGDWLHCNSLDFNPALDQVVVNSVQGEFYVIDHGNTFVAGNPTSSIALAATSAGDFLYRFGDPARYGQGNPPSVGTNWETATSGNKQIGGSSNAQWIASGIPGAGHLLVFDNNQYLYQPQSYVFEINPYLNSSGTDTGAYVNPPTAGYVTWTFDKDTMKANQLLSKQVVWKHGSLSNLTLFSHFGSSAQRLPNGNTLICATTEGYLVEVDASGNVVWEYINPVTDAGIVTDIGDDLPMTNAVPRALRYAATFAGFTGHDLTATATIAESAAPIASFTFSPSAPKAGETVTFTDTSANGPTSWSWSFGDGGTSSAKSPTHVFATAGAFTVSLTATNAAGPGTASKVVTVSSGGATVSVTRFLPIVLDVTGRARYVSELTLANRGSSSASVTLLYTAASAFGGQGSGSVSLSLAAGRQLVLDDAIGSLRSSGLSIPSGNQGGSLRVTFANVSSADAAYAGVRITAPSENGRAGVAYVGPLLEALPSSTSWLYGLRSSSEDRTNVAFANASTSSSVTLRLTLVNGNGSSEKHVFDDVTLGPGQWAQLDDVFVGTGFSQGYASVSVVSGSGPYFAYAVFNDNGTNDGSFAPFESEPAPSEARLVPVVVETGTYSSELVLANTSSTARTVELSYVESLSPSQGAGGTTTESLAAGEQKILPSILDLLRTKVGSIGPSGGSYAGSLSARFLSGGNLVAGYAGARTGSPARSGTGRYGLFYAGVGTSSRASSAAWVYGLRQDSLVRTNVAVAASPENSSSITVHAEVWNGSTGSLAGTTDSVTLSPGGWKQWANLLPTYGVAQGYVRVVSDSSSGSFTAYAVVNDGPAPGSANGTDDGSFVPAVNVAAP